MWPTVFRLTHVRHIHPTRICESVNVVITDGIPGKGVYLPSVPSIVAKKTHQQEQSHNQNHTSRSNLKAAQLTTPMINQILEKPGIPILARKLQQIPIPQLIQQIQHFDKLFHIPGFPPRLAPVF